VPVIHWDEVEVEEAGEVAHMRATWRDLGRPAGSVGGSVNRVQVAPGCRSTPVHQHLHEEETFFVLGGSGLSWQDGKLHELGPGDVVLHRAGEEAHTVVAGDDGIDFLVFGAEPPSPVTFLPRARVMRTGGSWVDYDPDSTHPFEREPADLPGELAPRPDTIVAVEEVPSERIAHGRSGFTRRKAGLHLGALTTGFQHVTVEAGMESWPPHCHSADEEVFVVLDGEGSVVLGDEEVPVRRGSVVARPPATGVPHHFTGPVTYLAWSLDGANDMTWYPRSRKVSLRGLGIRFHVEPVEYWEGESS
jgi:uncharacterized cupin superfamily protein